LQRLALDRLDLTTVRAYLGDVVYDDQHPLPSWAKTLDAVMQAADRWSKHPQMLDWQFSETTDAIAFEPFYAPCLEVAIEQLTKTLNADQLQRLSEEAYRTLRFSLIERLQSIVARTLFQEFSQFRSSGNAMRDFFFLQFQGRQSQVKYREFLHKIFQDGYRYLFETYPVLGRLIATAIDFWVEAMAEFLQNLSDDWAELEQRFSQSRLKQVVELKLGLSDPHNRGQTTIVLQFDTGLKLVYKPKDLGTDIAYFQFLEWCNRHGLALPFKCLTVLNRTSHGWVEFVEAIGCADEDAAHRFYQRSGMLLCLVHSLEGTDCHYENLIAHGEQPILIDTETLLTHRMVTENSDQPTLTQTAFQQIEQQLHESVLRTMLLPQRDSMNNDRIQIDLSGFGGVEEQEQATVQLRDINTDGMQVEFVTTTVQPNANAPVLAGKVLSPEDYLEDLVTGFQSMADFLRQHQTQLLSAESPLKVFAHQTVRYVFRATNTYATILQQSYQPEFLKSGVDRSIHLEILSRAFLVQPQLPPYVAMLKVEQQAMEQMDIPFFTLDSSQDSLTLSEALAIPGIFQAPSFDQVLDRLQQFDPVEIDRQVQIIRGTFDARFFQEPSLTETTVWKSIRDSSPNNNSPDPTATPLIRAATQIADSIERSSIQGADDSITWLSIVSRGKAEGFQFGNVGVNLADGSCGISLFLAALYRTTGNDRWHNLALRVLQPLRESLQIKDPQLLDRFVRQQGMSSTTGLTGILYSLMQIGRLLKNLELRKDAYFLASLIHPEAITLNLGYDVNQGLAGIILGLLVLPEDEHALRLATHCGELLLGQKAQLETALRTSTIDFQHLMGFYQGLAGVAYALLRLYAATQDGRFCQAAIEVMEYERPFLTQLPVKAPGIGLARLGSLAIVDTPEIRQDIEQALKTTQQYGLWGIDSLLWGNVGRLETVFTASQHLQRPELATVAQQTALKLVNQASDRDGFALFANRSANHAVIPGLFYGLAGIGYQLLRFAHPELPSILLWETK
jgi:type 2 lantibiotic biosynthesis protein LanM